MYETNTTNPVNFGADTPIATESGAVSPVANTEEQVRPIEKPYTFRKLSAEDVFPMFNIIKKIGLNEFKDFIAKGEFKNIVSAFTKNETAENVENAENETAENDIVTSVGISIFVELANVIICNIPKCEDDIFKLLSSTSNLEVEQVRKLGLADFAEMIIDFVKKEEFGDFIKVVSKLFK